MTEPWVEGPVDSNLTLVVLANGRLHEAQKYDCSSDYKVWTLQTDTAMLQQLDNFGEYVTDDKRHTGLASRKRSRVHE